MVRSRRAMPLPFLFLVAAAGLGGVAQQEDATMSGHYPPLLDCAPASTSSIEDRAFRANLASALDALPSAAAAAPESFATTRSGGTAGRDRAFARGLCFDANPYSSPAAAARACRACLSAAARDVARGCGASMRAGVWREGCFVAYADTDAAPSAREDAFRAWFYAANPSTIAAALDGPAYACAGDRTVVDCERCYNDSLRAAASVGWLPQLRGDVVVVVGYSCCVLVQLPPQGQQQLPPSLLAWFRGTLVMLLILTGITSGLAAILGALVIIIDTVRGLPNLI